MPYTEQTTISSVLFWSIKQIGTEAMEWLIFSFFPLGNPIGCLVQNSSGLIRGENIIPNHAIKVTVASQMIYLGPKFLIIL